MSDCDGWCGEFSDREECVPPVVPVTIGWDGAEFNYCQTAIRTDRDNGFIVKVKEIVDE